MLYQEEKPDAYDSRALTSKQQKYAQIERDRCRTRSQTTGIRIEQTTVQNTTSSAEDNI